MRRNIRLRIFGASLVLSSSMVFLAPAVASAQTQSYTTAALQLEDALRGLQLSHVSALYAYLQSINLTQTEVNQISANAAQVKKVFGGATNPNQLTTAQKEEAVRLFINSAQLAHLQVQFVTSNDQPVNLITYSASPGQQLLVQLKSSSGQLLGTIYPKYYDIQPQYLSKFIGDVAVASKAAYRLEQSPTFIPMPSGKLPITATQDPLMIAVGLGIVALGGLLFIPARRFASRVMH